jgi:cytochrome P450
MDTECNVAFPNSEHIVRWQAFELEEERNMPSPLPTAAQLPIARPNPFDPPEELAELRRTHPLSRMMYPDGHVGWLVTTHALARRVLADPRFSARSELQHRPVLDNPLAAEAPKPAAPGMFLGTDPPDHTRYRRLLASQFTVRRMRQLTTRVQQITAEHLDAIEQLGPPVDLVATFAQPIPAVVICELLGVPYGDRERFNADIKTMTDQQSAKEQAFAALTDLAAYIGELIAAKRAEPTDDMLSGLVRGSELTDEELANIGFLLLGAGLETTANMIALGTFALLQHPDQLALLRDDPEMIEAAVEELLRYLSIIVVTIRTALEDIELDGHVIRAGETVTISISAANRDPEKFNDPETLDLRNSAAGHVAFGHGIHQCLGQQLARVEMQVAYPALFQRFPTLRLAVPPDEVPTKDDALIYGVRELPVTWDGADG